MTKEEQTANSYATQLYCCTKAVLCTCS